MMVKLATATAHSDPFLHSITDTRKLLGGISRGHIYNMIKCGILESRKLGNRTMITAASIRGAAGVAEDRSEGEAA
jgi:hypothetical protein